VIIRTEQMSEMSAQARRRANVELASYARRRFPTRFADNRDDTLLQFSGEVRIRAAAFGIEREDHVATWLDLTVMYGADFSQAAWAAPIVNDKGLGPDEKIAALTSRVEETGVNL
jgi:hypothetical protein